MSRERESNSEIAAAFVGSWLTWVEARKRQDALVQVAPRMQWKGRKFSKTLYDCSARIPAQSHMGRIAQHKDSRGRRGAAGALAGITRREWFLAREAQMRRPFRPRFRLRRRLRRTSGNPPKLQRRRVAKLPPTTYERPQRLRGSPRENYSRRYNPIVLAPRLDRAALRCNVGKTVWRCAPALHSVGPASPRVKSICDCPRPAGAAPC